MRVLFYSQCRGDDEKPASLVCLRDWSIEPDESVLVIAGEPEPFETVRRQSLRRITRSMDKVYLCMVVSNYTDHKYTFPRESKLDMVFTVSNMRVRYAGATISEILSYLQ
jgi:hypothetical protein